ncbi:hypothetical protein [Aquimarina sp. RZ0]|uniref:hypothetical protein n=1 Tax=Aquimarina sp. RZ0 TaxID=2607730 RepID=UPI0011F26591|nr:hypothetical protein [Aquimarina sp. RZ0]KAA1246333.1 hypothetical protein F0000_08550 [Aquimarina sp. RZ0]
MLKLVKNTIKDIEENDKLSTTEIEKAKSIFEKYEHVILSQGKEKITLQMAYENDEKIIVQLLVDYNDGLLAKINGSYADWEINTLVALYVVSYEFEEKELSEGIKYTRDGMKKRVLGERMDKAKKASIK